MALPLYPPAGPQSIGRVLDSGFRIFEISLVTSLLYAALGMIAGQLQNIYFIASGRPLTPFGGDSPLWWTLYSIGAMIALVLYSAVLLRQHGIVVGRRLGTAEELKRALRRLPANLGVILIVLLLIAVDVGIVVAIVVMAGIAPVPENYGVIARIGFVALLPLVYFATPLVLAGAAVLLDNKGPVQAVLYLLRLVRGNWWRTTTILTVATVLTTVFYAVAMVIVGMVLPLAGATDLAAVTAATGVVYVVLGSIGLPFLSAVFLATYGELKVRKEGLDLEQRVAAIS